MVCVCCFLAFAPLDFSVLLFCTVPSAVHTVKQSVHVVTKAFVSQPAVTVPDNSLGLEGMTGWH